MSRALKSESQLQFLLPDLYWRCNQSGTQSRNIKAFKCFTFCKDYDQSNSQAEYVFLMLDLNLNKHQLILGGKTCSGVSILFPEWHLKNVSPYEVTWPLPTQLILQ